jgi:hypothetical protein
VAVPSLGRSS